jgi:hypothetical protein
MHKSLMLLKLLRWLKNKGAPRFWEDIIQH